MSARHTLVQAAVLGAGLALALTGCEEEDTDRDVEPDPFAHDPAEHCDFEGLELPSRSRDGASAFVSCVPGVACTLQAAFMSSLRADIDVDLSGRQVAVVRVLLPRPEDLGDGPALVNGDPVLNFDPCTRETRARFQVLLLQPGDVIVELEAGETEAELSNAGAWPMPVFDPVEIAIEREDGGEIAEPLELRVGDALSLTAVVRGAEGQALTTLGTELWWADDAGVLAAWSEADDEAGADAGVPALSALPPAFPARGGRIALEALAPGDTELHVLAGNFERVVPVTVTP